MKRRHRIVTWSSTDATGIVTAVDEELCTFSLNKCATVNAAYLAYTSDNFNLPELNQKVSITNHHSIADGVKYLCQDSGIELLKSDIENVDPNKLKLNITAKKRGNKPAIFSLIFQYKLGIADLIIIDSFYKKFRTNPLLKTDDATLNPNRLALEVVSRLIHGYRMSTEATQVSCSNNVLPKCQLLSPSDIRYVDIKTKKYNDFVYWSFGVHRHTENKEILVGFLFINHFYGVPMIQDIHHGLLCLILDPEQNLKDYLNCCVIIKKFTVITEIYSEESVLNLEYCVFALKDVQIIERVKETGLLYRQGRMFGNSFGQSIVFFLKQKSVTKLSRQKQNLSEFWLQIDIIHSNISRLQGTIFLLVNLKHIKIVPYLQLGSAYKLYFNKYLVHHCNNELKKFYPSCPQYFLSDQNAIFQLYDAIKPIQEKGPVMNVKECQAHIVRFPDQIVSFQGKLKIKKFNEPIGSRTERNTSIYGFGTPGVKTHVVEFAVEGSRVKTLTLYLNNWEDSLIPCGLIPEMRIHVKNVMPQKSKYLKCTSLTSFEIIGYEPAIEFTTTNLFTGISDGDWGRPFHFGLGDKIPYGVLVTGEVLSIRVKYVTITTTCLGCNRQTRAIDCRCAYASSDNYKFDVSMMLIVRDIFGDATIKSRSEDLLRCILGMRPDEFKLWCVEFRRVGYYDFSWEANQNMFCEALTDLIKSFNELSIMNIELVCRKLDTWRVGLSEPPVWFCIRARRF